MDMKIKFRTLAWFSALFVLFTVSSCGTIFDEQEDCPSQYLVKFKYDMNMKFADAFPNAVSYVTVHVYDAKTGKLVLKQTEGGEALTQEGYSMELIGIQPGTYDIIAWCGDGLKDSHFSVVEPVVGTSAKEELNCMMKRENGGLVKEDVGQLFHGMKRVTFGAEYGTYIETLNLTKNTNVVRVVLQHLSGLDVDPNDFTFEIKDENGFMAYDNAILDDEELTYSPWSVTAGSAGVDADIFRSTSKAQTSVSVALAEFTIGRLMTQNNPVLSIYNIQEGERVLSIPLKDYALLVKGNYNKDMSDQEYLDRQDEYNLTFFLDEHGKWVTSRIIINSWAIVRDFTEL